MPLLSVYVTNYNYGPYIKQALDSLINQTFKDFEIIIIDDGSTDNSREIIESYSHLSKVSVIYQKNKGLNISNNVALKIASGKYIMRLDADDYLAENALEVMVNKMEGDESLGLIFPDYFLVSSAGEIIGEEKRHDFSTVVSMLDLPAHGACTMIRSNLLRELGGYDESFTCQDGYDLWIKFISNHKVDNISQPLFFYRQHTSSLSRNEEKILETRAKIKQSYLKRTQKSIPSSAIIIPVRGNHGDDNKLALKKIGGVTLLELRINYALNSKNVSQVIISSPDVNIENFIIENFGNEPKVIFHRRENELARYNTDLKHTVRDILENYSEEIEVLIISPIEYPFITTELIDDAINTMVLFAADSVVTVRPENNMFFQHHGEGMRPILNQDKFTKLEREILYRNTGGLIVSSVDSFIENDNFLGKRVGHIVVTKKAALSVNSPFDFKVAEFLMNEDSENSNMFQISP